ncbi:MAG TPA: histidine kinase [Janthinobacterium sp.]|nr:histidine kinase [Janthinobacterium sp.]
MKPPRRVASKQPPTGRAPGRKPVGARARAQERQIEALLDITALLSGPGGVEQLCRGFLQRLMAFAGADGGTVRTLDSARGTVHVVVHAGVSERLIEREHCIKVDDCLCGAALVRGVIVIRDFATLKQPPSYSCQEEGFASLAVFPIVAREEAIGSFSLHFARRNGLDAAQRRLLTGLGLHLGAAIENRRLVALEQELAVAQERSLLAQGLHDSIAQGLNLLNLQVQMLEKAVARDSLSDAASLLPLLRAGIDESYGDVRELLANFRTRWPGADVAGKLREVLSKFERASGIACTVEVKDGGAPLAPGQQLQVLFILQEALSNIRKHAGAGAIAVSLDNGRDFSLVVRDDGCGFAPRPALEQSGEQVGLHIMRERAERLGARLDIVSAPGAGTTISLHLGRAARVVA